MLDNYRKLHNYYSYKATFVLILGWSCIMGISVFWNVHAHTKMQFDVLSNVARANAGKDYMYKKWLGALGGAYVEEERIDTSSYPEPLRKKVLKTADGKNLAYINPALMLSQVKSDIPLEYVFYSEIKTLNPMFSANQPDSWEKEALRVLSEGGGEEYLSVSIEDGQKSLRLMLPFYADAACVKSWAHLEVKVKEGDLIGGMSLSLPASAFEGHAFDYSRTIWEGHVLLWALGVCGILFALRLWQRENMARGQAELLQEEYQKDKELLLNSAGEGIYGVDTSGKFTFVNMAAAQMLGYSEQELLGKESHALCHHTKEDGSPYPETDCPIYASFKEGTVVQGENEIFWRKNGTSFPLQYTSRPISRSGSIIGAVVTFSDITKRKMNEQRLRESRQRFKATFLQAAVGIAQIGLDGCYLSANPKFCEITGYSEPELRTMRIHDVTHADDLQHNLDTIASLLSAKEVYSLHLEKRYLHKNGTIVPANVAVSLVRNAHGEASYIIAIVQDISAQKNIEEERNALQSHLLQTQKMEAIGTLAGGVAHDFNNILTAILGYAGMAQEHISDENPAKRYIDQVLKAGDRSKDLVQQILTFSRKGKSEKTPIRLSPIIHESLKLLRSTLPSSIELQSDIDSQCGEVMANATQIHQVVMNLCTNAYHAIDREKGLIKVSLKRVFLNDIDLVGYDNLLMGSYVRLEVSDSGSGMNPATCAKIFEPYFTTKVKGKGTGLGLSVTHGIVKNHSGDISVVSEEGLGTTFTILLPVLDGGHDAQVVSRKEEQDLGGNEHVLVVDDEEMIVEMTQYALEGFGYSVTTKTDPAMALEIFRANPHEYDVVITDMTMPKITGDILASEMLKIQPDLPIIICTGYSTQINKEKIDQIGIRELVLKPFLVDDLAATVRKVLDS